MELVEEVVEGEARIHAFSYPRGLGVVRAPIRSRRSMKNVTDRFVTATPAYRDVINRASPPVWSFIIGHRRHPA